jgi:hypothetical protein
MNPVTKLGHTFDHETLLKEYISCQRNNALPSQYTAMEVYIDGTYRQKVIDKCPYTVAVIEKVKQLGCDFNFVLFRQIQSYSTVSWHIDPECKPVTFHIPVKTNSACFYVYDYHLYPMQELGELYRVDIDKTHTAINVGETPRVHLHFVYDIKGNIISGDHADRGVL